MASPDSICSGLVRAIPGVEQEETDGESGVKKGPHTVAGPNGYLHSYPSCRVVTCAEARLVSPLYIRMFSGHPTDVNVFRYMPPHINPDKSNIKNSENTALFLTSCFEYIFIGIVLNAGRPFRQPMNQNCKFKRK